MFKCVQVEFINNEWSAGAAAVCPGERTKWMEVSVAEARRSQTTQHSGQFDALRKDIP
jgi:hypothetical protein